MLSRMRSLRAARLLAPALMLALAACSAFGGRPTAPATTATTTPAVAEPASGGEIDVRRYLGPNYCPELRIYPNAEVVRRFERGHDNEVGHVVWQASIGKTARECLYEVDGRLTLKVGVSGRVISGPKGGAASVAVPLRLAVVKYKEKVLASESYQVEVAIPPQGSAVFTEVHEIALPSPGDDRDYILYVALSDKERDWLDPSSEPPAPPVEVPVAAAEEVFEEEREEAPPAAAPPPPPQPATPKELPVPSGFVLPGG
jgi:hypothetical protein